MGILTNLRTSIQFTLEGLGQGSAQWVLVAIKPLLPQLVPCFSFSLSQQGTWSLLGANYWPSVSLGQEVGLLLGRLHLEEKSFCFRNEKRWEEKVFASL